MPMGLVYRACFQTGAAHRTELKDIALAVRAWASKKCGCEVPEFAQEIDSTFGQKRDLHARGAFMDRGGAPCLAFELSHPDAFKPGLNWRATLAFAKNGDGLFDTEISLYKGWDAGAQQVFVPPSAPAITGILIQRFGGRCGFGLGTVPIPLSQDKKSVEALGNMIFDPERKLPILLISASNFSDRPVLPREGIEEICWRLAGIARVYVAIDRFSSFKMDGFVGKSMGCWDGAARLYWPIPAEGERPFHPYWTADRLGSLGRKLVSDLLGRISAFTSGLKCPVTFPDLMAHKNTAREAELLLTGRLQEALAEHGDLKTLLQLYVEDNTGLKARVAELEEGKSDLEQRLQAAMGRIEQLTLALEGRRGARPDEPTAGQQALVFSNVLEAVQQIQRSYPERTIVITKKALDGAKGSLYEEPGRVYNALEWLATAYLQMGKADPAALKASALQRCGMTYHASQGGSVERHPEDYHVTFDGRTYELKEHLAKGTNRDPRHSIRIGFDYDAKGKRVIVGYISQHQTTGASR